VLISRGSWFAAEKGNFEATELFFRATFAAASEDKMTVAIERFGVAVKASFGV
jgi:aromatic amino acid aminotransferase I